MGGGGEFLAGLMSGIGDSYARASEEKRRVDLTKKQLEQQNQQFQQQIALARQNQQNQFDIQSKQLDLEKLLGQQRIDLSKAGLAQEKELTLGDRVFRAGMQDKAFAQGVSELFIKHGMTKEQAEWQSALSEMSADRGVGRAIAQAKGVAEATLPFDKERIAFQKQTQAELAALTGEDLNGKLRIKAADALWDLKGALVASKLNSEQDAEKLAQRMTDTIITNMSMAGRPVNEITNALTTMKQAAADIRSGDANRSMRAQRALAPLTSAIMDGDPSDPAYQKRAEEELSKFMKSDSRPDTTETRPTDLTKNGKPDPRKINLSDINDVYQLVNNVPGLKADLEAEAKTRPELNKDAGFNYGSPQAQREMQRLRFLQKELQNAEGSTLDEKIENVKARWDTFRNKKIGIDLKEIRTEGEIKPPNGIYRYRSGQ